jgi:hypothetical protein
LGIHARPDSPGDATGCGGGTSVSCTGVGDSSICGTVIDDTCAYDAAM